MHFISSDIPDVMVVDSPIFRDDRGFFQETYHSQKFEQAGITPVFVQDNHSFSVKGVLRGLHYQVKHPQGKLIRVIRGRIFDVAVDLRKKSPTFGKWVAEYLSGENKKQLWIPVGFAHGFLTLSETADVIYKCTDHYAPEFERTILWDDPQLAIEWPLKDIAQPRLTEKDLRGFQFRAAEVFE